MAKVISNQSGSEAIISSRPWWQMTLLGLVIGLVFLVFTYLASNLVDTSIAGNIATIIAATIGIVVMVKLRMARPIIITTAAALILWSLADLTSGLSLIENAGWSLGLYGITYNLLGQIARFNGTFIFPT